MTDEFTPIGLSPAEAAGGLQSHNGLDLEAVEGGLTAEPAEGVGPKLVSRSWESARLSVEVDVAGIGPRDVDAHLFVNGERVWPTEITAEGDGRLIIEGELDPRSVPVGTHSVRVQISDGRGESASVGVGEVQVIGAEGSTSSMATTDSTDGTIFGFPRQQAVAGGVGVAAVLVGLTFAL